MGRSIALAVREGYSIALAARYEGAMLISNVRLGDRHQARSSAPLTGRLFEPATPLKAPLALLKTVVALLGYLALSGCASHYVDITGANRSSAQADMDRGACGVALNQNRPQTGMWQGLDEQIFLNDCMLAKGWKN